MSLAPARPNPALLVAVGERLSLVLESNRRLAQSPPINFHARRRIEAVIAGLIDALDELDGDAEREQTAIETQGAGYHRDPLGDDAEFSDNGIANWDGLDDQFARARQI